MCNITLLILEQSTYPRSAHMHRRHFCLKTNNASQKCHLSIVPMKQIHVVSVSLQCSDSLANLGDWLIDGASHSLERLGGERREKLLRTRLVFSFRGRAIFLITRSLLIYQPTNKGIPEKTAAVGFKSSYTPGLYQPTPWGGGG